MNTWRFHTKSDYVDGVNVTSYYVQLQTTPWYHDVLHDIVNGIWERTENAWYFKHVCLPVNIWLFDKVQVLKEIEFNEFDFLDVLESHTPKNFATWSLFKPTDGSENHLLVLEEMPSLVRMLLYNLNDYLADRLKLWHRFAYPSIVRTIRSKVKSLCDITIRFDT